MKLDSKYTGEGSGLAGWCPCSGTCGLTCANACFGCKGNCTGSCAGNLFLYPQGVDDSEEK